MRCTRQWEGQSLLDTVSQQPRTLSYIRGFPGGTVVKNLPANAGDARDAGSIPGLGRSPGVGNGNRLQYSCQENSMDRGAWWATVHGVAKSQTRLSTHTLNNRFPVRVKQASTGRKCCLGFSQLEKRGQCLASKDRLTLL